MTAEQVQHFRKHGFVAVPTFFDARETAAIRAEVERLQREGYLRNVATDGDGKTASQTIHNLQLCPMYRQSPLFRALPFAERVVEAVRDLLGNPNDPDQQRAPRPRKPALRAHLGGAAHGGP